MYDVLIFDDSLERTLFHFNFVTINNLIIKSVLINNAWYITSEKNNSVSADKRKNCTILPWYYENNNKDTVAVVKRATADRCNCRQTCASTG